MASPASSGVGTSTSSFERLLAFLDPESRGEAIAYARVRAKLEDFFRYRGLSDPEGLADECLDRVSRRLAEGLEIHATPSAFVFGVARHLAFEGARRDRRTVELPVESLAAPSETADLERRHDLLEQGLSRLPSTDRELLLEYHRGDGRERIESRRALAERSGMGLEALRVRAFRIRTRLERLIGERDDMERGPRTRKS